MAGEHVCDVAAGFWDDEERPILLLLSPRMIEALPKGVVLYSINGTRHVKGKDEIDLDTRGGMTAFGVRFEHDRYPDGSFV